MSMPSSKSKVVPSNGRGSRPRLDKYGKPIAYPGASAPGAPVSKPSVPTSNDRLLFASQVLMGHTVEVQVKNGAVYSGIFHAVQVENKDVNVVLKMAKAISQPDKQGQQNEVLERRTKTLIVYSSDLVQVVAKDIRMVSGVDEGGHLLEDSDLLTDTAISAGRGGLVGRELQRWAPEEGEDFELGGASGGIEDRSYHAGAWDQFALNRSKFGVETTWDEELYTTKLDKGNTKITEAEAARIAAEIEGKVASNTHMAEERGLFVDDSQLDEEDKYSSVLRPAPPQVGGSLPPQHHHQHQQRPSSSSEARGDSGPAASASKPTAWSTAGAGVAAVTAGSQQGPRGWERPTAPPAFRPPSAAIDIDPRKEHNKLRMQLAGSKVGSLKEMGKTSPYGTPKGMRSPLASPLVGNASQVEALNLDPGHARVDADTRQEFIDFKQQQLAAVQAHKEAMKKNMIDKFKKDKDILDKRVPKKMTSNNSSSSLSSKGASESGREEGAAEAGKPEAPKPPSDVKPQEAPPADKPAAPTAAKPTDTSTSGPAAAPPTAANGAPPVTKSTLNPFAKSFTFNPNAKEFKPGVPAAPKPAPPPAASAVPPPHRPTAHPPAAIATPPHRPSHGHKHVPPPHPPPDGPHPPHHKRAPHHKEGGGGGGPHGGPGPSGGMAGPPMVGGMQMQMGPMGPMQPGWVAQYPMGPQYMGMVPAGSGGQGQMMAAAYFPSGPRGAQFPPQYAMPYAGMAGMTPVFMVPAGPPPHAVGSPGSRPVIPPQFQGMQMPVVAVPPPPPHGDGPGDDGPHHNAPHPPHPPHGPHPSQARKQ